jgi:hypothetical protein
MPHKRQMGVQDKAEISDGHNLAFNSLQKVAESCRKFADSLGIYTRILTVIVFIDNFKKLSVSYPQLSANYLKELIGSSFGRIFRGTRLFFETRGKFIKLAPTAFGAKVSSFSSINSSSRTSKFSCKADSVFSALSFSLLC